jgi:dihydropteroate synthase
LGNSRKKFIKELSGKNDTKKRMGGTVASSLYLMMQGVQILRVHEVDEILQGIKVFKELIKKKMTKKYFGTDGIRGAC